MVKKIKALILFANPRKTPPLQISKEKKIIEDALNLSKYKSKLKVTFVTASTIHDLRRNLLNEKYNIVQISGHGTPEGLILETEDGEPHIIEPQALANLLQKHKSLECLIFNACHSISQGIRTALSIPFTIAMEDTIADKAALEFSRGFYDAIGAGTSYEEAYEEGCQNVELCFSNAKFRAEFLKQSDPHREAFYQTTEKTQALKTFTNIWYADRKYSIWSVRNTVPGTLTVFSDHLEFNSSELDLLITAISCIRHTKMGGDLNNNWVEVVYQNGEAAKFGYFAEASKLGIGNLLGGSEELFDILHKQFASIPSAKENDTASKGVEPPAGNTVNVRNSNGNVVVGGNITDSTIYLGNSVPKPRRKK